MNAPVRPPLVLTNAQFEDMARRGAFVKVGRVELRGGMIAPRSPVHLNHSTVLLGLINAVQAGLGAAGGLRLNPEVSISFGDGFAPTADLAIWAPTAVPQVDDGPLPAEAVRLVIEVADSSLGDDLGAKMQEYAAGGLAEYWVADVKGRALFLHADPGPDGYRIRRTLKFGEPAAALTLPLTVDTAAL